MGSFCSKTDDNNEQETPLNLERKIEWEKKRNEAFERVRNHKFIYEKDEHGTLISVHWDDKPHENLFNLIDSEIIAKGHPELEEQDRIMLNKPNYCFM